MGVCMRVRARVFFFCVCARAGTRWCHLSLARSIVRSLGRINKHEERGNKAMLAQNVQVESWWSNVNTLGRARG